MLASLPGMGRWYPMTVVALPLAEGALEASGAEAAGGARAVNQAKVNGTFSPKAVADRLAANAQSPQGNDAWKKAPVSDDKGEPIPGSTEPDKNPVEVTAKTRKGTKRAPLAGPPEFLVPHGGSTKAHVQVLKASFFFLLIFLIARELLDGTQGKPNGKQILAIMLLYMLLGFMATSEKVGKMAAALGLLIFLDIMLAGRNQAFLAKVGAFFGGSKSDANSPAAGNGIVEG